MQNNPLSFPPRDIDPFSPSSPTQKEPTPQQVQTQDAALEQLSKSKRAEESPDLKSKAIETPAPGVWDSLVKFFNRQFSIITQDEQDQAQDIKLLIGKVEQELNKITNKAKKAAQAEGAFRGKLPNNQTVKANSTYLKDVRKLLDKAAAQLKVLKDHEDEAHQLAEDHSSFSDLPGHIQRLEKNIEYLEARCEVLDGLVDLESAMRDYGVKDTWDNFVTIRDKQKELVVTLKDLFDHLPSLSEDLQAKIYAQKSLSNADSLYTLIKTTFPGLRRYVERLLDGTLAIRQGRIQRFEKQVQELQSNFATYNSLSQRISSLEKTIYDTSIIGRIYRLFYTKASLKKQVRALQKEQQEIFDKIQSKGSFQAAELKWLEEQIKGNEQLAELRTDISKIQQEITYLNIRQAIANQTGTLLRYLEFYRQHKEDESDLKSVVDYEQLKDNLALNIQLIAQNVNNWRFKSSLLPSNFTKMDTLDQLTTLISVAFPTLRERSIVMTRLINQEELHEDLNQAIEEGRGAKTEEEDVIFEEEPLDEEGEEVLSPTDNEAQKEREIKATSPSGQITKVTPPLPKQEKSGQKALAPKESEKRFTFITPMPDKKDEASILVGRTEEPEAIDTPRESTSEAESPTATPKMEEEESISQTRDELDIPLAPPLAPPPPPLPTPTPPKGDKKTTGDEQATEKKASKQQPTDLLADIRKGFALKKVETANPTSQSTPYERLTEQIQAGNIGVSKGGLFFKKELSKEESEKVKQDWDTLSLPERLKLAVSGIDQAVHDKDEESSDEDWD